MSKRLQVLISDQEMTEIKRIAKQEQLTVGEWVRRVLLEARANRPGVNPETKLEAIRRAVKHSFPSGDIEQVLDEIERGYQA